MTTTATLNDLFSDTPDDLIVSADSFRSARRVYRDTCSKCGGDGMWHGHGDCTGDGRCTMCDGVGYKEFKTSPEERAKGRESAARAKQREADKLAAKVTAWHAANPEVSGWLTSSADRGLSLRSRC